MTRKNDVIDGTKKWLDIIDKMKLSDDRPVHEPKILTDSEIVEIKAKCNPKYDTLIMDLICTIEALQHENEQLRAQVARMREACIKGFSFLSLLFHRADIRNWDDIGMCSVKDVKHAMDELENAYKSIDTVQDYHNSADAEALRKAREALTTTLKGIDNKKIIPANADAAIELWRHKQQIYKALAEIDKAIGGCQGCLERL